MALFDVNHFVITSPGIAGLELRDDFPLDFSGLNMPANIKPSTVLEDDGATASRALINGEWLMPKTVAGVTKMTRAGVTLSSGLDNLTAGDEYDQKFPIFAERGRIDIQTMKDRVPVIFQGAYEFDTKVIDTVSGHVTWSAIAVGTRLVVALGGCAGDTYAKYSVLSPQGGVPYSASHAGKGMVVGVVTKIYNSTTGYVRVHAKAGGLGLYF